MIIYFTWDGFVEVNVMKIVNENVVQQACCKTHCCSWCKG